MIQITPPAYDEVQKRLALGLQVIDAASEDRIARPISVAIDGVPRPLPRSRQPYQAFGFTVGDVLPRVDRHDSCVHALVYSKGLYQAPQRTSVALRFLSPSRRHVPRRISFPLVDPDLPEPPVPDPPQAALDTLRANRWRRVVLFPGAAYDVGGCVTGLRGRARRAGAPVRWVRVEARPVLRGGGRGPVFARAHGDDRGEFLLVLGAIPGSPLSALTVDVEVKVYALPADPPATDFEKANDPLWDLPIEPAAAPPPADDVCSGITLPNGYTSTPTSTQVVSFQMGTILSSQVSPFTF